jgi:hypothetical protein
VVLGAGLWYNYSIVQGEKLSKIVDLLTYRKRAADKKGYEDIFPSSTLSENFDTDTKEKIANTYIFNPPNKSENLKKAAGADPHLSPHKGTYPGAKIFHLFPWLISFFAILLLLVNMAYRGKINIKIEIVGDTSGKITSESAKVTNVQKKLLPDNPSAGTVYNPDLLILNGQANTGIIKKIGFYGAAMRDSKMLKDGIYLVNDGTTGWASAGFDMAQPADLTNCSLQFFVKGLTGGESLELILRDSDNNSYLPQVRNRIFEKNISSEWQFISIPFDSFKGYYNSKCVNHIGFEFGTQTTFNDPGDSVYIRDIKIVKK